MLQIIAPEFFDKLEPCLEAGNDVISTFCQCLSSRRNPPAPHFKNYSILLINEINAYHLFLIV